MNCFISLLTMAQRSVLVNTYMKRDIIMYIDPISKYFLIVNALFGLNRTSVLWPKYSTRLCVIAYGIIFSSCVIYFALISKLNEQYSVMISFSIFQYLICAICCLLCCKSLNLYFVKLNEFDDTVGCTPSVDRPTIYNLVQIVFTSFLFTVVFVLPYEIGLVTLFPVIFIPFRLAYVLEVGFYGHLLCLLRPRLQLINLYLESSMSSAKFDSKDSSHCVLIKKCKLIEHGPRNMKKVMDVYHIIVEAYEHLIEAIKWPFVTVIIMSFITLLGIYLILLFDALHTKDFYFGVVLNFFLALAIMLPLFGPCIFGDSVHKKVTKLKELLAASLYENKLDKSGRSVARALLEFIEIRNLTFRLVRVLDIDISLPFKFIGLLVTYLIIILQFEKVIHLDSAV